MIRVTLDTSVLVSALFFRGNERRVLEAAIDRRLQAVISPAIVKELTRLLTEKFGLNEEMVQGYVLRLIEISDYVLPGTLEDVYVRDRDDVKILECAHFGRCQYVATGDKDLLVLREYKGIKIVGCKELLSILGL